MEKTKIKMIVASTLLPERAAEEAPEVPDAEVLAVVPVTELSLPSPASKGSNPKSIMDKRLKPAKDIGNW